MKIRHDCIERPAKTWNLQHGHALCRHRDILFRENSRRALPDGLRDEAVPIDMDTFEEKGAPFITVDTVGAGEGEIVMWAGGSSSRQTDLTTNKPVDSSIVGIVDFVDILGKRVYDKGNAS